MRSLITLDPAPSAPPPPDPAALPGSASSGLGYVGLPLAATFAEAGVSVLGLDAIQSKVDQVNAGDVLHRGRARRSGWRPLVEARPDPRHDLVGRAARGRRGHHLPADAARPSTASRTSRPCWAPRESLAQRLRPGHLVVLESTTYPGTTREEVAPVLERSGLRAGRDFHLAFSPERVDPGRTDWTTRDHAEGRRRPHARVHPAGDGPLRRWPARRSCRSPAPRWPS